MALELSRFDPGAEDIASKFFEHFVHIADAINTIGGTGLWNEEDGFYGDTLRVECPTGSGRWRNLAEVAKELSWRLVRLFLPGKDNCCPYQGDQQGAAPAPDCRDRLLFYECFHGETGAGLGASHQTGWTALVAECLERTVSREGPP